MPSFPKAETEKANRKFLGLVKKHECLWNRNAQGYSYKPNVDKAWNEIAKDMGDSPKVCSTHWRKIRRAFSRSFKVNPNGTCQRSEYYLANSLEFLRPHIKHVSSSENASQNFNDDSQDDDNVSIISMSDINIKEEPSDSFSETVCSEVNIEQALLDIIKMEDDDSNLPSSTIQSNSSALNNNSSLKRKSHQHKMDERRSKERKEDDIKIQCSSLIDANRKFFESLIPFIDEMNVQQNRRFRREIMCLIDDVLDDKDLEE